MTTQSSPFYDKSSLESVELIIANSIVSVLKIGNNDYDTEAMSAAWHGTMFNWIVSLWYAAPLFSHCSAKEMLAFWVTVLHSGTHNLMIFDATPRFFCELNWHISEYISAHDEQEVSVRGLIVAYIWVLSLAANIVKTRIRVSKLIYQPYHI